MKINIIGSGWLAIPLAKHLKQAGHELLVTTTQAIKIPELEATDLAAIQYQLGDQLSEPAKLFDTDVLIIAITSKDIEAFDILLDQLADAQCQHVLFISSTSIYLNDGQSHDEESNGLNHNSALLAIENIIKQHPSSSIIRFAGLVGPKRHPGRFFQNDKVIRNPQAPVNLIHLDDCITIIQSLIENKAWNEVFNGCADTHPTKADFYFTAAKQLGLPEPQSINDTNSSYKIIENHKIKRLLNIQLKYPDVMKMTYDQ